MTTQFPGPSTDRGLPVYAQDISECAVGDNDMYAFSAICESHFPANLLGCTNELRPPSFSHSMQYSTHWHEGPIVDIYPPQDPDQAVPTYIDSRPQLKMLTTANIINSKHALTTANIDSTTHNMHGDVIPLEPLTKRVCPYVPNTRLQCQGAHEGLDTMTRKVVETLQRCGQATFYELHKLTGVETRRLYDITNLLASTPFVTKAGRKRERAPFVFGDGTATDEPVAIEHILLDIELEQMKILTLLDTFNRRAKEGGQFMFIC